MLSSVPGRWVRRAFWAVSVPVLFLIVLPGPAEAIPAFARKYRVSCSLCHSPFPRLNDFGARFAANGFVFARGEEPRDTMSVGDPMLRLQRNIPLAIRVDAYVNGFSRTGNGVVATDLQTPWGIKVLSGGQITEDVSYYMYFFLTERGEVAGLEDAYVQFSDVLGSGVDVIAGQFQVSDPLFKRELRLPYEDYQIYRVRVGEVRPDVTYDRGFMASFSPWSNGDFVVQLVNGQGLNEATAARVYDTNSWKNLAVRYSHDLGALRVGGFWYAGRESSDGLDSDFRIVGPDVSVSLGSRAELDVNYLRRTDDNPFFLTRCDGGDFRCAAGDATPFRTQVDALMAQIVVSPGGPMGKWYFTGLYNRVESDRPVFRIRVGERLRTGGYADYYETFAIGAHYFKARNLRLMGEVTWDFERDRARITTGVITAF